jgi:hypothetical protein
MEKSETAAPIPSETRNVGVAMGAAREIRNVGMLDLTGLESPEALDGVVSMRNVGAIIVPESLLERLSRISMRNVGATIPVPPGARPRVISGNTVMSGDALANEAGGPDSVLVVSGNLILTSPVTTVGFSHFIASGNVIAPEGSEAALGAGVTRLAGNLMYYPYAAGAHVRVRLGSVELHGRELANTSGQDTDILLIVGRLSVIGAIERLGYQHVAAVRTLILPPESAEIVAGRVTSLHGRVLYSAARVREISGDDTFGRSFFEYLDDPILLIVTGSCTLEDDVTPEALKSKVAGIMVSGSLVASRDAIGMVQALTLENTGSITLSDVPRTRSERERERSEDNN